MSEHPLPDNLADWPDDPRALLGVAVNVTPRELRRAYNRLIRLYKPEQAPEQFRRIREAYEHLLRIAEWFAPPDDPPAEELPPPEQIWKAPTPIEVEDRKEEARPEAVEFTPETPRRPEDELEALWQEAIAGQPSAAYERLAQMTQSYAGRAELYLRLYWLRRLFPERDARRVPADWLVQGLLATGMAGPLRELYRTEVADDPAEALSERFERLLAAPLSPSLLVDLMEWRSEAARRLERWDILQNDLTRLRSRFGMGEESLWLRLVFALANQAWGGDPAAVKLLAACRDEIKQWQHLASSLAHSFDRFDWLLEAFSGWCNAFGLLQIPVSDRRNAFGRNQIPVKFLLLLSVSWGRSFSEVRSKLMEFLEEIVAAPQRWLDHFDEIQKRGPAALALFGELLDQLEASREDSWMQPRDHMAQIRLVLSLLPKLNQADYPAERSRILTFCLREDTSPEEMADTASGFSEEWQEFGASWASSLQTDWPLRYVCRAYRLFWA